MSTLKPGGIMEKKTIEPGKPVTLDCGRVGRTSDHISRLDIHGLAILSIAPIALPQVTIF